MNSEETSKCCWFQCSYKDYHGKPCPSHKMHLAITVLLIGVGFAFFVERTAQQAQVSSLVFAMLILESFSTDDENDYEFEFSSFS